MIILEPPTILCVRSHKQNAELNIGLSHRLYRTHTIQNVVMRPPTKNTDASIIVGNPDDRMLESL